MRIGILTAGGDCPGLNAVIRAVAKTLLLRHRAEVVGFEDGYCGLIEGRSRPLGYREVSGILTRGGTVLGTDNRVDPFRFYKRAGADVSDEAVRHVSDLGLDGLVVLGGDGTMAVASRLLKKGLQLIGVPKTIDNDVRGTERTVGFDTAVGVVTEAVERVQTTAQSHHRVQVVETMGRSAGWIALAGGLAGGADVILLPEIDFDIDAVVAACRSREDSGQRFTVIVVAEGAKPRGAEAVVQRRVETSPEPVRLGGIGLMLAALLEERLSVEARATVLGHVQRGGPPSPADRLLASRLGVRAADLVAAGVGGRMVAVQSGRLTDVAIEDVALGPRVVPADDEWIDAARGVGTSFGEELPPAPGHPLPRGRYSSSAGVKSTAG